MSGYEANIIIGLMFVWRENERLPNRSVRFERLGSWVDSTEYCGVKIKINK